MIVSLPPRGIGAAALAAGLLLAGCSSGSDVPPTVVSTPDGGTHDEHRHRIGRRISRCEYHADPAPDLDHPGPEPGARRPVRRAEAARSMAKRWSAVRPRRPSRPRHRRRRSRRRRRWRRSRSPASRRIAPTSRRPSRIRRRASRSRRPRSWSRSRRSRWQSRAGGRAGASYEEPQGRRARPFRARAKPGRASSPSPMPRARAGRRLQPEPVAAGGAPAARHEPSRTPDGAAGAPQRPPMAEHSCAGPTAYGVQPGCHGARWRTAMHAPQANTAHQSMAVRMMAPQSRAGVAPIRRRRRSPITAASRSA